MMAGGKCDPEHTSIPIKQVCMFAVKAIKLLLGKLLPQQHLAVIAKCHQVKPQN
jgi:hypothetical protein